MARNIDLSLLTYASYDDYLNSFVKPEDHCYISGKRSIKNLVKLGYRSVAKVYEEHEFNAYRNKLQDHIHPRVLSNVLFSNYLKIQDAALIALADREESNLQLKLAVRQRSGFDLSGYIDYQKSLQDCTFKNPDYTNWKAVFEGRILLRPKPTDLSYYDWHKGIVCHTDTDNFQSLRGGDSLMFKHRLDHKLVPVTSKPSRYSENVTRLMIKSDLYGFITLYDHIVR